MDENSENPEKNNALEKPDDIAKMVGLSVDEVKSKIKDFEGHGCHPWLPGRWSMKTSLS